MRALLVLGTLAVAACAETEAVQSQEGDRRELADATAARIEVVVLETADATLDLDLPGEVGGTHDAQLAAANGGFVESVLVDEGESVRKGQTLVRVDTEMYSAQLEQAEAQLEQAEADLERLEALGDLGTASQLQGASTQVRVASAQAKQARTRLSRASVRAPFAGVVAAVGVERGEVAAPGSPVARLVQLDPAIVTLSVSDRDVVSLEPGMEVRVTTSAQSSAYPGVIKHIAPAADMRTRAFPVEIAVPNPDGKLLPGMIARVTAQRALADNVMVVPQDWIVTRRELRGVFVVDDGHASWRDIELGEVIHDRVVVTAGLSPGDRVVITGHRELVDGDPLIVSRQGTCCAAGRPAWDGE